MNKRAQDATIEERIENAAIVTKMVACTKLPRWLDVQNYRGLGRILRGEQCFLIQGEIQGKCYVSTDVLTLYETSPVSQLTLRDRLVGY